MKPGLRGFRAGFAQFAAVLIGIFAAAALLGAAFSRGSKSSLDAKSNGKSGSYAAAFKATLKEVFNVQDGESADEIPLGEGEFASGGAAGIIFEKLNEIIVPQNPTAPARRKTVVSYIPKTPRLKELAGIAPVSISVAAVSKPVKKDNCAVSPNLSPDRSAVFNEISWMSAPGVPESNPEGEWLEIRNTLAADINLKNWRLEDADGNIIAKVNRDRKVKAGQLGIIDLEKDGADGVNLSNYGEHLYLFEEDCRLSDELDMARGWIAGNAETGQTMEHESDRFAWHTSVKPGGTPKKTNSVITSISQAPDPPRGAPVNPVPVNPIPANSESQNSASPSQNQSPPKILIAAVQTTAGAGRAAGDLIKIFNAGSAATDISSWKLRKRTRSGTESSIKVFPANSAISPGGYFIWANSGSGFDQAVSANVSSTATISDDASIALEDASGQIADALAWGENLINPFVEGTAFGQNPKAGEVLSRKSLTGAVQDTNDNQSDFELR